MTRSRINLNADMGEGFGAFSIGSDEALLPRVASVNIACGFHGGDASIMRRLVMLAARHGVEIGAHPGFNDLWGFGRREIRMQADEIEAMTAYQIAALQGMAQAYAGKALVHVKPHGALYNMAARDDAYAMAIAAAARAVNPRLILVGPPHSKLQEAAAKFGLAYAREGFCDRRYSLDGSLVPRDREDAIIADPALAARQAVMLACENAVTAICGARIAVEADTICIHGDRPQALQIAEAVRAALIQSGTGIVPLAERV